MYTNKNNCSSPTPDFYAFKYIVTVIAKESRDCAKIDLQGFFLQTKKEEDTQIILYLAGSVVMLLVDSYEQKWKKHLHKEDGKWVIYVVCNKLTYSIMNAALLAYKKLPKLLTG